MTGTQVDGYLAEGRRLFDLGEYRAAAEVFTLGARMADGARRAVLEALAHWATALRHERHGQAREARGELLRALEKLQTLRQVALHVDPEELREALVQSLERATTLDAPGAKNGQGPRFPAPRVPRAVGAIFDGAYVHDAACPYCGERVQITVALEDSSSSRYVEDCPVCCRPWAVTVTRRGSENPELSLERSGG